jgi:alkylresorcinol/alkylpyrone synthase
MSVIAAVQGVLPPHRYTQAEITDAFVRFPG